MTKDQIINTFDTESWKDKAKKLFGGLGAQQKYQIRLEAPNVDIAKFGKEYPNFEKLKPEEIRFEIMGIGIDPGTGNVDLDLEKLPVGSKSYRIQFPDVPSTSLRPILESLFDSLSLKNSKHLLVTVSKSSENSETITTIREPNQPDDSTGRNVKISIGNLPDSSLITQIVKAVLLKEKNCKNFNISFQSTPKNLLTSWENYVKDQSAGFKIFFEDLSISKAKEIVPVLRGLHCETTLQIRNMSQDLAEVIFKNADLKQEEILVAEKKDLSSSFMADCLPFMELRDLSARGITLIVTFNERKFVPWLTITTVVGIAALQTAAGGVLICTGFGATLGMGLITEGMSDLVTAQRIYANREFSWTSYGIQKAVSLTISAVSMGLSSLKDGAAGAKMIVEGGATEIAEQAAVKLVTDGKTVAATIQIAGGNMKSILMKHIATSTLETGGRIALTTIGNGLSSFCFEQVKETIVIEVSRTVDPKFHASKCIELISYYFVLDREQLKSRVRGIVEATVNPRAGSGWAKAWNGVGLPLMQGILSSPQFFGSTITRLVQVAGVLSGMKEIALAVEKVMNEIVKVLEGTKPTVATILQSHRCGLSKARAVEVEGVLKFGKPFELDSKSLKASSLTPEEQKKVLKTFETLRKDVKSLKPEADLEISQIKKSIVDTITNQIIRIANQHFVSPAMSVAVGAIVAKLSEELQDRFLVDEAQNTAEQNKIKKRVEELKGKDNRTKEEDDYLRIHDTKNTFKKQIQFTAKELMVSYTKRDRAARAMEAGRAHTNSKGQAQPGPSTVEPIVESVLRGGPTDAAGLLAMAEANGKDIKIVDDPNYQPTPEEIEKGTQIIVYQKPPEGEQTGHFSLLGSSDEPSPTGRNNMDCGYDVMSQITGKSVEELRVEHATVLLDSPDAMRALQESSDWLHIRYPEEASEFLMTGGFRSTATPEQRFGALIALSLLDDVDPQKRKERIAKIIQARMKSPEVKRRAESLTPTETTDEAGGVIYILKVKGEDGGDHYKVGFKKDGTDQRIRRMSSRNNEEYEVVAEFETNYKFSVEATAHRILAPFHTPKGSTETPGEVDGKTEWFCGPQELMEEAVRKSIATIDEIHRQQ